MRTSDWSSDMLTDEQIAYAVGDVSHLLDLHRVLTNRLEAGGLSRTFEQVCAYMPIDAHLQARDTPTL